MSTTDQHSKLMCKDCDHSFIPWSDRVFFLSVKSHYKCRKLLNEVATNYNPVTGFEKVEKHYEGCMFARMNSGLCGPEGKLWTPKHKKDLFLAITR